MSTCTTKKVQADGRSDGGEQTRFTTLRDDTLSLASLVSQHLILLPSFSPIPFLTHSLRLQSPGIPRLQCLSARPRQRTVARAPNRTLTASNSEGTTQKIIMMETDSNTVEDVIRPVKDIVSPISSVYNALRYQLDD